MVDKDGTSRMTYYTCETCGVQLDDSKEPPSACPICTDDRQFVGWEGRRWTTLEKMRRHRFKNRVKRVRRGLHQITTEPPFAICQRAFLVETGSGNLLWDCITYLDGKTISAIEELGGIDCIAISHPHYYSSIVEWSDTFGERRCTYTNRTECGCRGRVQRSPT